MQRFRGRLTVLAALTVSVICLDGCRSPGPRAERQRHTEPSDDSYMQEAYGLMLSMSDNLPDELAKLQTPDGSFPASDETYWRLDSLGTTAMFVAVEVDADNAAEQVYRSSEYILARIQGEELDKLSPVTLALVGIALEHVTVSWFAMVDERAGTRSGHWIEDIGPRGVFLYRRAESPLDRVCRRVRENIPQLVSEAMAKPSRESLRALRYSVRLLAMIDQYDTDAELQDMLQECRDHLWSQYREQGAALLSANGWMQLSDLSPGFPRRRTISVAALARQEMAGAEDVDLELLAMCVEHWHVLGKDVTVKTPFTFIAKEIVRQATRNCQAEDSPFDKLMWAHIYKPFLQLRRLGADCWDD